MATLFDNDVDVADDQSSAAAEPAPPPTPDLDALVKQFKVRQGAAPAPDLDALVKRFKVKEVLPEVRPPATAMPGDIGLPHEDRPETTKLEPAEEQKYQDWRKANIRAPGIANADNPSSRYDMRGFFEDKDALSQWKPGEHFPDTYKQHGYPTFSVESKYSKGPYDGGTWTGPPDEKGEPTFEPGGLPPEPGMVDNALGWVRDTAASLNPLPAIKDAYHQVRTHFDAAQQAAQEGRYADAAKESFAGTLTGAQVIKAVPGGPALVRFATEAKAHFDAAHQAAQEGRYADAVLESFKGEAAGAQVITKIPGGPVAGMLKEVQAGQEAAHVVAGQLQHPGTLAPDVPAKGNILDADYQPAVAGDLAVLKNAGSDAIEGGFQILSPLLLGAGLSVRAAIKVGSTLIGAYGAAKGAEALGDYFDFKPESSRLLSDVAAIIGGVISHAAANRALPEPGQPGQQQQQQQQSPPPPPPPPGTPPGGGTGTPPGGGGPSGGPGGPGGGGPNTGGGGGAGRSPGGGRAGAPPPFSAGPEAWEYYWRNGEPPGGWANWRPSGGQQTPPGGGQRTPPGGQRTTPPGGQRTTPPGPEQQTPPGETIPPPEGPRPPRGFRNWKDVPRSIYTPRAEQTIRATMARILGMDDPNGDPKAVQAAYRNFVRANHEDFNPANRNAAGRQRFTDGTNAYEWLKQFPTPNPTARTAAPPPPPPPRPTPPPPRPTPPGSGPGPGPGPSGPGTPPPAEPTTPPPPPGEPTPPPPPGGGGPSPSPDSAGGAETPPTEPRAGQTTAEWVAEQAEWLRRKLEEREARGESTAPRQEPPGEPAADASAAPEGPTPPTGPGEGAEGPQEPLTGVPDAHLEQLVAEKGPLAETARQELERRAAVARGTGAAPAEPEQPVTTETGEKHTYASTQVNLPTGASHMVRAAALAIPDEDLAPKGREDNPHITVKYGLTDDSPETIQKLTQLLESHPPITATLGKTSVFTGGEDGDVVKAEVDSPQLHALNDAIAKAFPNEDTHPEYEPHVTLAYVKPGKGAKYAGDTQLQGLPVRFTSLTFATKDGKQIEIPLKGVNRGTTHEADPELIKPGTRIMYTGATDVMGKPLEQMSTVVGSFSNGRGIYIKPDGRNYTLTVSPGMIRALTAEEAEADNAQRAKDREAGRGGDLPGGGPGQRGETPGGGVQPAGGGEAGNQRPLTREEEKAAWRAGAKARAAAKRAEGKSREQDERDRESTLIATLVQEALHHATDPIPDTPEARAKLFNYLNDELKLSRDIVAELNQGAIDQSPRAILKAIADRGGISLTKETGWKGEIKWLKEAQDRQPSKSKQARGNLATNPVISGQIAGVRGVLNDAGGRSLDDVLTSLRQDPEWQHLETLNDLWDAIRDGINSEKDQVQYAIDALLGQLRARENATGRPWWSTVFEPPNQTDEERAEGEQRQEDAENQRPQILLGGHVGEYTGAIEHPRLTWGRGEEAAEAQYTGNTVGKLFEIRLLEGPQKGSLKLVAHGPTEAPLYEVEMMEGPEAGEFKRTPVPPNTPPPADDEEGDIDFDPEKLEKQPSAEDLFDENDQVRENALAYERRPIQGALPFGVDSEAEAAQRVTDAARGGINAAAAAAHTAVSARSETGPARVRPSTGLQLRALGITPELVSRQRLDLRGHVIHGPTDLASLAQVARDPRFETLRVVYVQHAPDGTQKIVANEAISSRLPDAVTMFVETPASRVYARAAERAYGPDMRRWPQPVVDRLTALTRTAKAKFEAARVGRMNRLGATGFYLIHNHPSGNSAPSQEDVDVTVHAASSGIGGSRRGLLGHIVIDHGEFSFISPSGEVFSRNQLSAPTPGVIEPSIPHQVLGRRLENVGTVRAIGQQFVEPGQMVFVHTTGDRGGRPGMWGQPTAAVVRAIETAPLSTLNNPEFSKTLANRRAAYGGQMTILYIPHVTAETVSRLVPLIRSGAVYDIVTPRSSMAELGIQAPGTLTLRGAERVGEPGGLFDEEQPTLPGAEEARKIGKADTTFKAPVQATGDDFELTPPGPAPKPKAAPGLFDDDDLAREGPKGYATFAPYLTEPERATLRRDTAQRLVDIFDTLPPDLDVTATAQAGRAAKNWYRDATNAIRTLHGEVDAPRFAAVVAALSPRVAVETNILNAARFWASWLKAKRPSGQAAIIRLLESSVRGGGVLGAWADNVVRAIQAQDPHIMLSGPKVHSFSRNLVGDVNEVTNDTWVAAFMGVSQNLFVESQNGPLPKKNLGYRAVSAKVRRAAWKLSKTGELWTPDEVQASAWAWTQTLYELATARKTSAEDLVRGNVLTDEAIRSAPGIGALLSTDPTIRQVLEKAGYGPQLNALDPRGEAGTRRPLRGNTGVTAPGGTATRGANRAATAALIHSAQRLDALRAARDEGIELPRISDLVREDAPGYGANIGRIATRAIASVASERGAINPQLLVPKAVSTFAERALVPTLERARAIQNDIMEAVSPSTRSPESQFVADRLALRKAEVANRGAIEKLQHLEGPLDRLTRLATGKFRTTMLRDIEILSRMSDDERIAATSAYEMTGVFPFVSPFYSQFYHATMDAAHALMEAAYYGPNGRLAYIDNYVRRHFLFGRDVDRKNATEYFRRTLSANRSPLKGRILDMPLDAALADMRARGIRVRLAETHPEKIRQWALLNAHRAVTYGDFWNEMRAGRFVSFVKMGTHPPRFLDPIGERGARYFYPKEIGLGQYYADPDVARVINNAVSEGLENVPLYQALMFGNISLNQIQLGLSFFHATFSAFSSGAIMAAQGLRQFVTGLYRGDVPAVTAGALKLVAGHVPYLSATVYGMAGRKFIENLRNDAPAAHQFLAKINAAGGRLQVDHEYSLQAVNAMMRAWREGDPISAGLQVPSALLQAFAHPLMGYAIPRIKLGALIDAIRDIDARFPHATDMQKQRLYRAAQDEIDNVLGLLVRDNGFWKKTHIDIAQGLTRSLGWTGGSQRMFWGAAMDTKDFIQALYHQFRPATTRTGPFGGPKGARGAAGGATTGANELPPQWVTDRMLHVFFMLAIFTPIVNAIYKYLHTGKGPESDLDYYHPLNGRIDPVTGEPSRSTIPMYTTKDYEGFKKSPLMAIAVKTSPIAEEGTALLRNRNYWDDLIFTRHTPIFTQQHLYEYEQHFLSDVVKPFSAQQMTKAKEEGGGWEPWLESLFGIGTATKGVTDTEAQALLREYESDEHVPRSPAEVEKANLKRAIREAARAGARMKEGEPEPEAFARGRKAIDTGKLTDDEIQRAVDQGADGQSFLESGFKRQPFEHALRIYEVATPKERGHLQPMLVDKWEGMGGRKGAEDRTAPADLPALLKRYNDAIQAPVIDPATESVSR